MPPTFKIDCGTSHIPQSTYPPLKLWRGLQELLLPYPFPPHAIAGMITSTMIIAANRITGTSTNIAPNPHSLKLSSLKNVRQGNHHCRNYYCRNETRQEHIIKFISCHINPLSPYPPPTTPAVCHNGVAWACYCPVGAAPKRHDPRNGITQSLSA